jgi:NAD(P)-dependent dehydrogenase (short-subunit alcohol dehydrogenase family)
MRDRVAVVTGASSGIGRAVAVALARSGFVVGVGFRRDEAGARATLAEVEAAGSRGRVFALDLGVPQAAAASVEAAIDALGGVDVFVNNAGVNRRCGVLDESVDGWDRLLAADLTGPFFCAQAAARRMVAAGMGGRIVNVTSIHEHEPILGGGAYCAAKAGLGLLTQVMALELAPHGITVNAVAPGETATPMNGVADDVDAATIARPGIPLGRPARSGEVASLVAYLAGEDAAYVTGASLRVDGGLGLMATIANAADASGSARHQPAPAARPPIHPLEPTGSTS